MKTKQLDLFAPEPKKEVPDWARPVPRTPKWMRGSDPTRIDLHHVDLPLSPTADFGASNGVSEWSARSARLSSKKGSDMLMRQETTGLAFRHELAQYNGKRE